MSVRFTTEFIKQVLSGWCRYMVIYSALAWADNIHLGFSFSTSCERISFILVLNGNESTNWLAQLTKHVTKYEIKV